MKQLLVLVAKIEYTFLVSCFFDMSKSKSIVFGCLLALYHLALCVPSFRMPLWWNYVACALDGCSGGFYAMLLCVFSTIADTNPDIADRVFWISVVTTG